MKKGLTIREALLWGAEQLIATGNSHPRMDSETLLALALSLDRAALFARPESTLTGRQFNIFESWIKLRKNHYPIQYIRGFQEFYGRNFRVGPGILIPRPETELVVDTCLDLCRSISKSPGPVRILDIGTGSGCIAISLAAENPDLQVAATDLHYPAVKAASLNAAALLQAPSGIDLFVSDLGNCLPLSLRFDFIVSNPPYVGWKDIEAVDPSVRRHEPGSAVFSGETGFEIFQRIFSEMPDRISPGGFLVLEIGAGQNESLKSMAREHGWKTEAIHPDLAGIPRCMVFSPDR